MSKAERRKLKIELAKLKKELLNLLDKPTKTARARRNKEKDVSGLREEIFLKKHELQSSGAKKERRARKKKRALFILIFPP